MAKRKVTQDLEVTEVKQVTGNAVSAGSFFEQNQRLLVYGLGVILLAVAGWYFYKTQIVEPKQQEAMAAMWQAEMLFERDSFQQALNGPEGGYDGFLAIIDKYSGTKAANLSNYYAGVCYLQSNDIDNAMTYMDAFDPENDVLAAMKYGILGDCYSEKQDFDKAMDFYGKAGDATENEVVAVVYLKRLGLLQEKQGKKEDALKTFERIRRDYPNPGLTDWREIEKYIYRLGGGAK